MRFETFDADQWSFDLITFVASIHHLPLRESLQKGARNAHARRGTGACGHFGQQDHCRLDVGWSLHRPRTWGRGYITRHATSAYSSLSLAKASVRSEEWPATSYQGR
jgi:hypothetical protein